MAILHPPAAVGRWQLTRYLWSCSLACLLLQELGPFICTSKLFALKVRNVTCMLPCISLFLVFFGWGVLCFGVCVCLFVFKVFSFLSFLSLQQCGHLQRGRKWKAQCRLGEYSCFAPCKVVLQCMTECRRFRVKTCFQ